ncbi:MAG: lipid-A-disaccharide synthase [Gammaproteobacteria bacterium]
MTLRIGLVAGEASGDILGAGLVTAIQTRYPDAEFRGIAGPRMVEAGVVPLFDADELAVIGLFEVLGRLPRLLRVRRELVAAMTTWRPDVFVGIDSPDFNLPVETRLRRAGLRTVHYVSPTVWAWRPGRVATVARAADRVLCLLPFEPDYYDGIAEFVGHPLADRLAFDDARRAQTRERLGFAGDAPVVAVLPGSRGSELKNLGAVFAGAVGKLGVDRVVAPMVNDRLAARFARECERHAPGVPVVVTREDSRLIIEAADVVLTASGTATLECLLLDRPMVVAYRLAPLTAWVLRTFGLLKIETFSLPNLLTGERVVPELIQENATPDRLAVALGLLLEDGDARAAQHAAFARVREQLKTGADERAAAAVLTVATTPNGTHGVRHQGDTL